MTGTIKIFLAIGEQLLLAGIQETLEHEPRFVIVGQTTKGPDVASLARRTSPDVVLLDTHLPGRAGLMCLSDLRTQQADVSVVMLSDSYDRFQILAAFRRGACGYILKTIDPKDLAATIHQSIQGTTYHAVGLFDPDEPSHRVRHRTAATPQHADSGHR